MKYFSWLVPDGLRLQTKRTVSSNLPLKKIYWISRHSPTLEQRKALILLHGQNLLVVTIDHCFRSKDEFLAYLRTLTDGFAYAVLPQVYFRAATRLGEFCGHNDDIKGFSLRCVYHYEKGCREWKLGASQITNSGLIEIPFEPKIYYSLNNKKILSLSIA